MNNLKELEGMWRYFPSKKLRRRVNQTAIIKLALKLNREMKWSSCCGMCRDDFNLSCPFYCKTSTDKGNPLSMENHLCLAPEISKDWYDIDGGKNWMAPQFREKYKVIGCYLVNYCVRGYENYARLKAWNHRARKDR